MEMEMDDLDELDDVIEEPQDTTIEDTTKDDGTELPVDFVDSLLQSMGITDKDKIKFENEDGEVEELSWDDLDNTQKLNLIQNQNATNEDDLDDDEIELVNAIRKSGLSPVEYLRLVEKNSVDRYMQNASQPSYTVDQYSDDELFLADFISRMGDITDEEAQEALASAKANESLFQKLIGAIRNEYRMLEQENAAQAKHEQEQYAQAQYNQFAQSVVDQINGLTEISGYDLNMEHDDMQNLYDFITGQDAAGNNYFSKALSNPATLVKTAWFALNGEQMINDITRYFQKEITNVRKESYKKGLADAGKKDKSTVVYKKSTTSKNDSWDDFE